MSRTSLTKFTELTPAEDPGVSPPDPCALLGWMMQLHGTVRIAGLMQALPRPTARAARDAEPLSGAWDWQIDAIERAVLQPLRDPFRGKTAMIDAEAAYTWLADNGLLARAASEEEVARAATALAGAFHRVVVERVSVTRGAIRELRRQLGERLRALGPGPAYLELVDQAARDATDARAHELLARVPRQLVKRFRVELAAALAALPAEPALDDVQRWYALDGWLHEHARTCRAALRAVCQHEARALKGLVAAADEMVANGSEKP